MPAVTELDVFTAVRAKLLAAGGWFAAESLKFHFGRRPPNAAEPPYAVIAVEEAEDNEPESDGAVAQKFAAEIAIRAVGPEDAQAATAALVAAEPRWHLPHGMTLPGADQSISGVMPRSGKLRLLEALMAGADQYTAARRWEIHTAAFIGA